MRLQVGAPLLVLLWAVNLTGVCLFAQTPQPRPSGKGAQKEEKAVIYSDYKRSFKELCEYIGRDGWREEMTELLAGQAQKDPGCRGCRPFFLTFAGACRPPKQRRVRVKPETPRVETEGSESPSASSTPHSPAKEMEPGILVVDSVSRLFEGLSRDELRIDDTYAAVVKLTAVLRSPVGKSRCEFNYFSTLAEYLAAPFDVYAAARAGRPPHAQATAVPRTSGELNELFN